MYVLSYICEVSEANTPAMLRKEDTERRISQHCRRVRCQRLFVQKEHSQYFEVRGDAGMETPSVSTNAAGSVWSDAWGRASQLYDMVRADDVIRAGEVDEVNPWLRRTGWIPYLEGFGSRDVLRCIQEPVVDEDVGFRAKIGDGDDSGSNESVAAAIWQAMEEVARISQDTVSRSGVVLRFEAIRTESHQNVHRPLEPYQNRDDIARQGRYWQQIIAFFVRTRQTHEWQGPQCRFNRRQDRAFQRMITEAQRSVVEPDETTDSDTDSGAESDTDSDTDRDTDSTSSGDKRIMTELQSACLSFCIELLNQRIHNHEYDMALICE